MCGIVAAVTEKDDVLALVVNGLKRLEYRGYDSAGVAVLTGAGLEVRRRTGKIAVLEAELERDRLPPSNQAIAHTRWATHGVPADRNAHPHRDDSETVVVAHNGIIENYAELRGMLASHGHTFASETDTEVLANLIAHFHRDGADLHESVRKALAMVEGAYALVVISAKEPGTIIAARKDSPLVLGLGSNGRYAASDIPALLEHTRDFVILENGETAKLTADSHLIFNGSGAPIEREVLHCDWSPEQAEKGGYPHFMLKEIEEQPDVLARTAFERFHDLAGDVAFEPEFGLEDDDLRKFERVRLLAMGTSFHSGMLGELLMAELARIPGETVNASEFLYSAKLPEAETLSVVISQSGETLDTLRAMREVHERGGTSLGICNVRGSSLFREARHMILTHCGPEVGVASTKAFFGQVTALYLLAIRVGRARGVLDREQGQALLGDLRKLRPRLDQLFSPEVDGRIRAAAELLAEARSCLFIGRSFQYPIALEGALKLKEISYVHAEGYAAGEMKHGPIALIDPSFPVVAIATAGRAYEKMVSNIQEVRAREGRVIAVGTAGDEKLPEFADHLLEVPDVPELLSPLVTVIVLQKLAYQTALILGRDIDQPRNLAKSVTVE